MELQEADEDIQKLVQGTSTRDQFYRREGEPHGIPDPTEYQQGDRAAGTTAGTTRTMKIAHSIPLAGHMGQDKTARRFLMRFHWPTLFKDVAGYCRTCPECQCANSRRHQRVPLVPFPIMGEPFQRKAMDVVGPLPKSRRGNRFIMVPFQ